MEKRKQESHIYQEDEIDLKAIVYSLFEKKFLIASLTGFVTVLSILYTFTLTPTYKAISSFTSPSRITVTTINKLSLTTETKDSIFREFLTQLSSKDLQKLAFVNGGFLTLFNPNNSPIDDVDEFISSITNSVSVHSPSLTEEEQDLNFLPELPYSVTMEGSSAKSISEYLNSLVTLASSKTITELIKHNDLMISNRIEEISLERDLVIKQAEKDRFSKIERIKEEDGQKIRQINDQIEALTIKARRDRLNQIERIKEEDGQKIRQINDQIDRARYQAKENRLNQIVVLLDAAKLAKSLGIIENNFKLIKGDGASSDLTISIGENKDLPEWYLYGEKALIQRVELLENRMSDDPFIPELVALNNQLNEVQNNNLLKTLETRQDDSPFIAEIVKLDIEKIKLKSRIIDTNSVNAMQLSQISITPRNSIKSNKRMIVWLAFIGSFMMSIFLSLIMDALKPDEKAHTA